MDSSEPKCLHWITNIRCQFIMVSPVTGVWPDIPEQIRIWPVKTRIKSIVENRRQHSNGDQFAEVVIREKSQC